MVKLTGKDRIVADDLQTVLARHGYQITRYLVSKAPDGTSRFTINVLEYGAKVESKYAKSFHVWASRLDFREEWLSNEIVYKDETHTFEGFYVKPGKDPQAVLKRPGGGLIAVADISAIRFLLEALPMLKKG